MKPLAISCYSISTALGTGLAENLRALQREKSGLMPCDFFDISDLNTWVGEVNGLEQIKLPKSLQKFTCRNNQLALLGLEQDDFLIKCRMAIKKYGSSRIGIFIGTSTSGILQTEKAYLESVNLTNLPDWYHYSETQNIYSVAEFVRLCIGAQGPCTAISTACSSSAKVFASAQRAILAGLCDAAVVGGVDSLCLTTLYGFHSLQLISDDICRPADINRKGLSMGEAAGFALLEPFDQESEHLLLGYGESSDAYHMSSPHPEGHGAFSAMKNALQRAELDSGDIDYINLHGTATHINDLSESRAIDRLFGSDTPCSSTKGWTGHTLGAAGIVEMAFSLLCIKNGFIPLSINTQKIDPEIQINIVMKSYAKPVRKVLSNSFGFGGSNCSLIFGSRP
ncbi:MAG: beta-ketoacyl-[acyl-carrier-protein] synthase family protein [Gammaproteobacteria bacterium]|nr:beta-ketoacyl-[acyl-carrier-protein] synthase family protein [Gammaproteobacteria bacterium]